METYKQSKEGRGLQFLDNMAFDTPFDLTKMNDVSKIAEFRKIVNEVIKMTWDRMNGYRLEWDSSETVLTKKRIN
jgi:hypothetical protein